MKDGCAHVIRNTNDRGAHVTRFDDIYNNTHRAVLTYLTAKCAVSDINDVFQETYMELWRVLSKGDAGYIRNESAFVMKLAKRKVARLYSLRERFRGWVSLTRLEDSTDFTDGDASHFYTGDFSPGVVEMNTLRRHLETKPEGVQKIFTLVYDIGLTIPETAKALNMSESNVKNRLYRTLKELRQLLTESN